MILPAVRRKELSDIIISQIQLYCGLHCLANRRGLTLKFSLSINIGKTIIRISLSGVHLKLTNKVKNIGSMGGFSLEL